MHGMIIGGGSIGLLLAAKLAPHCDSLELVVRTERQAQRLQNDGITLDNTHLYNKRLSVSVYGERRSGISAATPKFVMLTVKQSAIDDKLARFVADVLGDHGRLICFQNGYGHVERLRRFVSIGQICLAVTTEGAIRKDDTTVLHTGRGTTFIGAIDEMPAVSRKNDIKLLSSLMNAAGFHAEASNRILSKVWNKLIINAVINPLTALLRVPNGDLLSQDSTLSLMRSVFDEAVKSAAAEGVEPAADLWEQTISVCRSTAANRSSMLQDLEAGRTTELDWITGVIIQTGQRSGLTMPVNETVYRLVKALESK